MKSKIKINIYEQCCNVGSIDTCYLKDLKDSIKSMYQGNHENQIYGIQVVLPKEKYYIESIYSDDVYRMSPMDMYNLKENSDLLDELISILIGMKLERKEHEIKNLLPLHDIWAIEWRRSSEGYDVGGFEEDIYSKYVKVGDKYLNR